MLSGQDYRTSQVAVIDKYGAIVERSLERENRRDSEKILIHRYVIHHESHMQLLGTEYEALYWEAKHLSA